MRGLEDLVDAGKVRYIGVSNFSVVELTEAQACLSRHRIVSNQIEYSLMYRKFEEDFPFYQRERICQTRQVASRMMPSDILEAPRARSTK